ncbi:tetratricopeptide repeat protein [Hymenobacter sp. H14-R3]|uniref:tetratricopeptide repeat protein n=1 Tax=Hymenobacter sp. H14-R3 TaxID=3046308 RepID=UPI0024B9D31C|nr:tetratricopeptide repeat protein [Hymenobacter sp. H14-R3]MDJ0366211.1 tetratricopeptide repeat protein [Hymenobacter sp. H14-R3]
MKYAVLCFWVFWSALGSLRAQVIKFEKDSVRQVFAQARRQHKPVLLIFSPPLTATGRPASTSAAGRPTGLQAPAVVAALNKKFLVKEVAFGSAEALGAALRRYQVVSYPSYLYFTPEGDLLYRSRGESTAETRYLDDMQAVRQAAADPHNLGYYRRGFDQGNRSPDFLQGYLRKRRALGQWVEPALLDTYAQQLPARQFDRAAEVLFILEFGPVLTSRASQLTHLNGPLLDSLYKVLPLAQRIQINTLIINNTLAQAIDTNNARLAALGADLARTSWLPNYQRGAQSYASNMLTFYRTTQDTANYLRQAVVYYDRYYLSISADSARSREATTLARQLTVAQQATQNLPVTYSMALNNAAWSVYQSGTRRAAYLQPAVLWSRRTLELNPVAAHYDTLAHLLYRLQRYDEALAAQRQAIALARTQQTPTASYEQELTKLQNRSL